MDEVRERITQSEVSEFLNEHCPELRPDVRDGGMSIEVLFRFGISFQVPKDFPTKETGDISILFLDHIYKHIGSMTVIASNLRSQINGRS